MISRRRLAWVLAAALVALAAFHVVYWYLPRERAAVPDPSDEPAQILESDGFDVALWVPYPHQNLGALERAVGDFRGFLGAAAHLAGAPPPTVPRFGPFAVPPSRELAVGTDASGRRAEAVARVFPAVALVSRLAGTLAGNPWLAGGPVRAFGGPARVSWEGTLWRLATVPAPPRLSPAAAGFREEALGALRLARPHGNLPAGTLLLRRRGRDLELASRHASLPRELVPSELLAGRGASIFLWSGPGGPLGGPPGALVLFAGRSRAGVSGLLELPGAASLHRPGSEGFRLPVQWLPRPLRGRLARGEMAGWQVVASDPAAFDGAAALSPALAVLASGGEGGPPVRLAAWIAPGPAAELVTRVERALAEVPLVDPRLVRHLADVREVARPLESFAGVSAVISADPDALVLRFHAAPEAD